MKSYAVQITEEALSDMEALYSYIAVRLKAPENAMKQYNRIADAILLYRLNNFRIDLLMSNWNRNILWEFTECW